MKTEPILDGSNVIGKKFIVTGTSTTGHNYPINEVLTFQRNFGTSGAGTDMAQELTGRNSIYMRDCRFVFTTIEDLKAEKAKIDSKAVKLADEIAFCEKHGIDEFSPSEFALRVALDKIENTEGLSLEDKTKMILEATKG